MNGPQRGSQRRANDVEHRGLRVPVKERGHELTQA